MRCVFNACPDEVGVSDLFSLPLCYSQVGDLQTLRIALKMLTSKLSEHFAPAGGGLRGQYKVYL